MKRRTKHWQIYRIGMVGLSLATAAALFAVAANAQTGGLYSLRATIVSGRLVAGGSYQLSSAIGQVTGGSSSGGVYTLRGQILPTASVAAAVDDTELSLRLFLPIIER